MQGKTKKILLGSIVLLVLIIGVVLFNLYNNGFKFYTYTTENYIKEQVEGIISMDDGKDYEGKIEELAVKEINGSYLGFFCIKDGDENQCVIAKYKESFDLGNHKVLNLDKIIKSGNSVAMLDLSESKDNELIILISTDKDMYEGINIVSLNDDEVLENIGLTDEGIDTFGGEVLKDNVYLLQYNSDEHKEIGIELVKKSEE